MESPWLDHFSGRWTELSHPIVEVHQRVYEIVDDGKVDSCGGSDGVCVPAKSKHGDVMIPVKENQFALCKQNEEGIDELKTLGINERRGPEPSPSTPVVAGVQTDGFFNASVKESAVFIEK